MPEGHTLHRAARLQTKSLGTGPLRMWSPQGRFDEGARVLDGSSVARLEDVGKLHMAEKACEAATQDRNVGRGRRGRKFRHVSEAVEVSGLHRI